MTQNSIARTARNPRVVLALLAADAVLSGVAYGLAGGLGVAETVDWVVQVHTTVGFGNTTPPDDTMRAIATWFQVTNFYLTLLLAAHLVTWLIPDSWTHREAEETEAKIDAICDRLGITPDDVAHRMLIDAIQEDA